jgi:hypothetical protein
MSKGFILIWKWLTFYNETYLLITLSILFLLFIYPNEKSMPTYFGESRGIADQGILATIPKLYLYNLK